jgi:hypothetical protein
MRREPNIPLFLWVTAAIVAHAVGGGGATEVVQQIEETLDIGNFASQVRFQAKFAGKPIEISMLADESDPEVPEDSSEERPPPTTEDPDAEKSESDKVEADPEVEKPDELARVEEDKKAAEEDKPKNAEEKKDEKKAVDLGLEKEKPRPQPAVVPNRRVAVEQHVEDKNQEDNPDAQFAGEHANRVEEETQAQITATDQNAKDPTPGMSFAGPHPDPGNADESRVAHSEETKGPEDSAPDENSEGTSDTERAKIEGTSAPSSAEAIAKAGGQKLPSEKTSPPGQSAQEEKAASETKDAMTETLHGEEGSFSIARAQNAQTEQKNQQARAARPRLPQPRSSQLDQMLGYGSNATTERGVRLNLTQQITRAMIPEEQTASVRKHAGEKRLSKHRGSWTSVGLERWRPALENYVASVQPGNQTALNTARVPFAAYLNAIHQQLHDIFAHGFLGHLDNLPPEHPLNNQEMSTHLEIALSREDGRIVKMGITKSSGVTAFDVGALESVKKAAPYGVPPGSIVSSDGNVYLHWEFHRKPDYACSTYFARPFIINTGQEPAPPRIEPKEPPPSEEKKQPEERSGSREKKQPRALGPIPS